MTEQAKAGEEEIKKTVAGAEGGEEGGEKKLTPEEEVAIYKKKAEEAEDRAKKAELDREDQRREAARATEERDTEANKAVKSQEESINNALAAAKGKFEAAQKDFEDAYDANDRKKVLDAQLKLNDAQAEMRGAEYNQKRFGEWKESKERTASTSTENREKTYPLRTGTGAVLAVPQSALDWAEKHPKFKDDEDYAEAVYAADGKAQRRGIKVYSKEYYDFIDKHLVEKGLDQGADVEPAKKKDEKTTAKSTSTASSSAAPVNSTSTSTSTNGTGGNKNSFRLTQEHIEHAAICFPDLWAKGKDGQKEAMEKYAARQLEIKSGKN